MTTDAFNLVQEKGPEALIGARIELNGVPYEIISLAGIGDQMIVYNLRNLRTMEEDCVLKMPRNLPGSPEYERMTKGYKIAEEAIRRGSRAFAPTQRISITHLSMPEQREKNLDASNRLVEQGIAFIAASQLELASELFEKALERDASNVYALHNKGVCLCYQEKFEEALIIFEKVLAQNPNDNDALVNKGAILFRKEDYQGAVDCYLKVLSSDDENIDAWLGLGRTIGTCGKIEEAIICFQVALRLDPLNQKASDLLEQSEQMIKEMNP